MKKTIVTIILASCTLAVIAQTQTLERLLAVQPAGSYPEYWYNGNILIQKPAASAQYINLSRSGNTRWSIGTVYNSNTFAIGQSTSNEYDFTAPFFTIKPTGEVGIGISTPSMPLDVRGVNSITSGGHGLTTFANLSGSAGVINGWYANGSAVTGGLSRSISYLPYYLGTTTTPQALTILDNGNVGIGISIPTSKLHISNQTSLSGLGGAYISVIQKQPNTTGGDGGLSVEYSLTAASATNELVNAAANMRSNNYLTGGGVVQYQRVLQLSSGSITGSTTTNLDMIRIEPGGSSGTVTNAKGLNIISLTGTNKWGIYDQSGSNWYSSGKVGIGDATPSAKLSVIGNAAIGYASGQTAPVNGMIVSGNVGIGTNSPDALLTVNGIIHAKEVKIDLAYPFADFVFENNYTLKPLSEVHSFIKDNGHLPEIPSAEEVKKNGMNISEMQVKLLQKVEELTLYAIDQQKRIEALEKELRQVKNK